MGIAITSQELDVKQKNLRRWRQDIENLKQACEKIDTKPQKQINQSENLANIEKMEEPPPLKTLKTEEVDADDREGADEIVAALFSEGGDFGVSKNTIIQQVDAHKEKTINDAKTEIDKEKRLRAVKNDAEPQKDKEQGFCTQKVDLDALNDKEDCYKYVQSMKSKKTPELAKERQKKMQLKVKMSGTKLESKSESDSQHEVCCQWCGILFKARQEFRLSVNLSQHQKRRHPLELGERLGSAVERLPCPNCPRSFTERSDYHRHLRHSHGPKKHVCHECGFATHLDRLLRLHRSKKHDSKEIELKPLPSCSFCGKKISQIGNLRRHEDVMHKRIRLNCDQCDLEFKDKRGLMKHKHKRHGNN